MTVSPWRHVKERTFIEKYRGYYILDCGHRVNFSGYGLMSKKRCQECLMEIGARESGLIEDPSPHTGGGAGGVAP